VYEGSEIIRESEASSVDERLPQLLERITMVHADCVVIQPFIDGNKRWARHVLSALLVDIGFGPGTAFPLDVKDRYLDGIDKAISGHPEQLGNLILDGMLKLREIFRTGRY
jgi:Fic family protein